MDNLTIRQIIKDHFYLFHLYPVKWIAIFRRAQFVPLEKKFMPAPSLKEKLINKLKETDDPVLLEEISNLFELQESDTVYQTTPQQKEVIEAALKQVKNNQTKTCK